MNWTPIESLTRSSAASESGGSPVVQNGGKGKGRSVNATTMVGGELLHPGNTGSPCLAPKRASQKSAEKKPQQQ